MENYPFNGFTMKQFDCIQKIHIFLANALTISKMTNFDPMLLAFPKCQHPNNESHYKHD